MAYVRIAIDCSRHLCKQRSRQNSIKVKLRGTNGCTFMSKPSTCTTKSTPMGVDNNSISGLLHIVLKDVRLLVEGALT